MRIRELLSCGRPVISFEFFPPKDEAGFERLRDALASLRELRPSFVSVTYGAMGETRRQTVELVTRLRADYGIEAMAHLTCVDASRDELRAVLQRLSAGGAENVLRYAATGPMTTPSSPTRMGSPMPTNWRPSPASISTSA